MLFPSVFNDNLFDSVFSFPDLSNVDRKLYGKRVGRVMKTDVREHNDKFELLIDLPGFTKDDIQIALREGNLMIKAEKQLSEEEKTEAGKVIRQERYSGSMQRSFYVGDNITEEDIHAKFTDGVLKIDVPKKGAPAVPEKKLIQIEG